MFWTVPLHHQEFFTVHTAMVCHTGLLTARTGRNSVLLLLASRQKTCITYTNAVCTVKNFS